MLRRTDQEARRERAGMQPYLSWLFDLPPLVRYNHSNQISYREPTGASQQETGAGVLNHQFGRRRRHHVWIVQKKSPPPDEPQSGAPDGSPPDITPVFELAGWCAAEAILNLSQAFQSPLAAWRGCLVPLTRCPRIRQRNARLRFLTLQAQRRSRRSRLCWISSLPQTSGPCLHQTATSTSMARSSIPSTPMATCSWSLVSPSALRFHTSRRAAIVRSVFGAQRLSPLRGSILIPSILALPWSVGGKVIRKRSRSGIPISARAHSRGQEKGTSLIFFDFVS